MTTAKNKGFVGLYYHGNCYLVGGWTFGGGINI